MVNNPQTTRGYENPAEWKKSGLSISHVKETGFRYEYQIGNI
jgi:hypothetical protein